MPWGIDVQLNCHRAQRAVYAPYDALWPSLSLLCFPQIAVEIVGIAERPRARISAERVLVQSVLRPVRRKDDGDGEVPNALDLEFVFVLVRWIGTGRWASGRAVGWSGRWQSGEGTDRAFALHRGACSRRYAV